MECAADDSRMPVPDRASRVRALGAALPHLSDSLLAWIERVIEQMALPHTYTRNPNSDLIDDRFLADLGDTLRIHHCFSNESLAKDKFEHALEWVARACGRKAELASRGNPGHDITIDGVRFSLKTEGSKNIRESEIHISKFKELGKGEWTDKVSDLNGLRNQFLAHMKAYDRVIMLRYLSVKATKDRRYELVEIPKALLERAATGALAMKETTQNGARPGTCTVFGDDGARLFELYFDGGTERKLQVKHLQKSACVVHADWRFARSPH